MPRPRKCKFIQGQPPVSTFKPAGVPSFHLEVVVLSHEEFEAIRLGDLLGLSQEDGAKEMGISRATFGRLINSAHKVVAQALVEGKALTIEGGSFITYDEASPDAPLHGRCGRNRRRRHGGE